MLGKMTRFAKKNVMSCGCLCLGVILVGLYVLKTYYPNVMEGMSAGPATSIKYFHMNGCGHCKKFSPVWDSWTPPDGIEKKKIENNDMSEKEKALGVSGFPTVLLVDKDDNKVATFSDERTAEKLTEFVNANK